MEIHFVHFRKDYGSYENAKKYKDGLCVISFFGKVFDMDIILLFLFYFI